MFGDTITMSQAVTVCLFSIAVVFFVLLAISYLIDVIAWVVAKIENKDKTNKTAPAPVSPTTVAPATVSAVDTSSDAVLVAAAISAYLDKKPEQFIVRSIRRVTTEETSWSQASRTNLAQ